MNKIDSVNNGIYILRDFNINLYFGQNTLSSKLIPSDVETYQKFCTFFGFKQLIKVLARATSRSLYNYLPCFRVLYRNSISIWVRNIGLSYHQLIYCTRKISRIKLGCHKQIKFCSFKHYMVDHFEQQLSKLDFTNYENFSDINEVCNWLIQKISTSNHMFEINCPSAFLKILKLPE